MIVVSGGQVTFKRFETGLPRIALAGLAAIGGAVLMRRFGRR